MSKTITITVDPEGKIKLETEGYSGPACLKATEALEKLLGKKVAEKKTPEFYRKEEGRVRQ